MCFYSRTWRILSTGFNSKETNYLLFVYEQAYLPYLKKSLMKSTIVKRNKSCSVVCSVKNAFNVKSRRPRQKN